MKFTYLYIDILSAIIPVLFSFHRRIRFYKTFLPYFIANFISAICFIVWDVLFTDQKVWGFNESFLTGWKFLSLPIEEVLFFFCIPYACVFTYHCFTLYFKKEKKKKSKDILTPLLAFSLFIFGIIYLNKSYTSVTFITTSLLLIIAKYLLKQNWIGRLYSSYLFLLIPFFIVNGLLTGTGLSEPVVWYNNNENMNIRILTVPVEDIVYGFELILLTVLLYEILKSVLVQQEGPSSKLRSYYQSNRAL